MDIRKVSNWLAERRKAAVALVGGMLAILTAFEMALPEGITQESLIDIYDKVILLVAAVTALVYQIPNKTAEDPDKTHPNMRALDLKSPGWLPLPAFVLLCLVMLGLSGCNGQTGSAVSTKEETLALVAISIETLAKQTKRVHEEGRISDSERAAVKRHLYTAQLGLEAAFASMKLDNEAQYYESMTAINAALAAARTIVGELSNASTNSGYYHRHDRSDHGISSDDSLVYLPVSRLARAA